MHLDKIQLRKGSLKYTHYKVLGVALLDSRSWNRVGAAGGKFDSYGEPGVREEAPMYQSQNRSAPENTFI